MASRPRVRSAALRRLEGCNRSLERSLSSPKLKEKGSAKLTGRKEGDDPSPRQEKPAELERVDEKVDRNQQADTDQALQSTASNCNIAWQNWLLCVFTGV